MSKVGDGHFKLKDAPSSSKLEKSPSNDNFGEFASNVFFFAFNIYVPTLGQCYTTFYIGNVEP